MLRSILTKRVASPLTQRLTPPPTQLRLAQVRRSRFASSSAGHGGQKSDLPWLLGSGAIFGSAAALLLMQSGPAAQATKHALKKGTTHMKEAVKEKEEESQSSASDKASGDSSSNVDEGNDSTAAMESVKQAKNIGDPKTARKAEAATDGSEETADKPSEDSSQAEEVSDKDIKQSLQQAEGVAVPRYAMGNEEEGHPRKKGDASETSAAVGSSDDAAGDEMSAQAVKDSLQQAEKAAVPRAAMADEKEQSQKA